MAYADAVDALRVVPACRPGRALVPVGDIALERAMVADPVLAAAGVERWLAPLARAPRGGQELVRTLAAWLDAGQSVVATARALGVAPRTVSYRLARIATLLGVRALDAEVRARLSAALLHGRLLCHRSRSISVVSELRPHQPRPPPRRCAPPHRGRARP